MNKQLDIREKALPTLKSKETALRIEVKRIAAEIERIQQKLQENDESMNSFIALWVEFPDIVSIKNADISLKNIAGVKIPILEHLEFDVAPVSYINQPAWVPIGIQILKERISLKTELKTKGRQFDILNYARKKTTQKVNLYEKVQIPEFRSAVLKIKRFLEDAENLSKSAQKIVKQRNAEKEAAL